MEVAAWDGAISRADFSLAARALADKWRTISSSSSPPWSWISPSKRPPFSSLPRRQQVDAEGYLSLEKMRPKVTIDVDDDDGVSNSGEEVAVFCRREEEIDTATLNVQDDSCEVHYYDLHVVYSESFCVPVLYFRGYCSDGRPLLLDEIEKDLPSCSTKESIQSKWTFITQEEHPYLNRPWYKLHPCGTGEWMKLLFLGAKTQVPIEGYLVSWLSVVGQVVGLRIPIEMAIDTPVSVANGFT